MHRGNLTRCVLSALVGCAVLESGCGDARDAGAFPSTGVSDDGPPDTGDETGDDKFDLGDGKESADDGGSSGGCAKIDFLFVIDHSASMGSNQENLANSFPGFVQTIEEAVNITDFHIMVIDTDAWGSVGRGDYNQQNGGPTNGINCSPSPECCAPDGQNCLEHPALLCNGEICSMPDDACDSTLGAGWDKRYPSLERCTIQGAQRYIASGQPDLLKTFECMAKIGTWGNGDEQVMEGLQAALLPSMAGPGGCNEGFVRDDALLVITFITDSAPASAWEQNAPYVDPQGWFDAIVAAKHGNPGSVVMLGLFSEEAVGYPQLVGLFGERGFSGSVAEPDYVPFFEMAVEQAGGIDEACHEFVPPG